MTNVWKRYREILQNLKSHQPCFLHAHLFVGAATLTLLIVILSSVREL